MSVGQTKKCAMIDLDTLVPAGLLFDVSCHVLADGHPLDSDQVDITICTTKGEVIELWQRQIVSSVFVESGLVPRSIDIYRNSFNKRFYLLETFENLYVLSTENYLKIFKHFENLDRYIIDDPLCMGSVQVKIWYKDDAIPRVLNENFDIHDYNSDNSNLEESIFISSLKKKLTEARYTVAKNETRYQDLLKFRHGAMFVILQDMIPNSSNSTVKTCKKDHKAIAAENLTPWIKLCNRKVVVAVSILNNTLSTPFENLKLIFQSNTEVSISYETMILTKTSRTPFWQRQEFKIIQPGSNVTVVAVTDIEEFQLGNKIMYSGFVAYEMNGKQKFLPLHDICLSCLETMNESFDVLSSGDFDKNGFLAILCTTSSIKVKVYQIFQTDTDNQDLMSLFRAHMNMDRVNNIDNVLIHRTSPYHVLNGVMMVFERSDSMNFGIIHEITVYLRDKSQLTSLLHLIYDGVPGRLVVTTPNLVVQDKRTSKTLARLHDFNEHSMEIDDILVSPPYKRDDTLLEFRESVARQMKLVLEYFDSCIESMALNRNTANLIGSEIDVLAPGQVKHDEFRQALNSEIRNGFSILNLY